MRSGDPGGLLRTERPGLGRACPGGTAGPRSDEDEAKLRIGGTPQNH
jgi:hypothetical protein